MDRNKLKELRSAMDVALAEVGKKYGVAFSIGNISYDADSFRTRLECAEVGTSKSGNASTAVRDVKLAKGLKLLKIMHPKLPDVGQTVKLRGEQYKMVGANTAFRSNQIIMQRVSDGKCYRFETYMVEGV